MYLRNVFNTANIHTVQRCRAEFKSIVNPCDNVIPLMDLDIVSK
jgi:hypothetical protein